jgi:glyoxylase-like metal-dependent hydrolase (beta-lactamase superfamily II)
MAWKTPGNSFAWIFPVGRGSCAFLRTRLNHGFILDMAPGYEGFEIGKFILKNFVPDLSTYPATGKDQKKIAQVILSHPHTDHISRCSELKSTLLDPHLLTCPNDKVPGEEIDWKRLGNKPGSESVESEYRSLFAKRTPPLQTIQFQGVASSAGLEYGVYYVSPPVVAKLHPSNDNHYTNSTSLVFWFRNASDTILFPGDIMPEGLEHILKNRPGTQKRFTSFSPRTDAANWHSATGTQPTLKQLLNQYGLSVLVAPHHGLESCWSDELYSAIKGGKPREVCISESYKEHKNFGDTDPRYQSERGAELTRMLYDKKWVEKRTMTTKAGHHILIAMSGDGKPVMYADTDPEYLLTLVKA